MKLAFRLSWLLIFVLGAAGGMVTMRVIAWQSSDEARAERVARRYFDPVPPGFFDVARLATKDDSGPALMKPGQAIQVEVLEALPGRPITGEQIVRPDGTIGLGFYGDVPVAGLNRNQIKVKVLEHLRKFLNDEVLGLVGEDKDGKPSRIPPVESDRIFIDDSGDLPRPAADRSHAEAAALKGRIDELDAKLDRILKELEKSRQPR